MLERILRFYAEFPSVSYATLALLLISLSAALLGVPLVLKRYSMIGDGLSHVSFGAASLATALGFFTPMYVALPLTILASVILLGLREEARAKADALIATVSSASLVFGYLALSLFPPEGGSAADACANLFGQGLLSVDGGDVIVCAVLALAVLLTYILCYNRIFAVTYDESHAVSSGIHARFYNTLLAVITGVVIVISMELVGALLISALIVFPAMSAMKLFRGFRSVVICAAIISVLSALSGLLISLVTSAPSGAVVVIVNIIVFALFSALSAVRARK